MFRTVGLFLLIHISLRAEPATPHQVETRGIPKLSSELAAKIKPYLNIKTVHFQDWQLSNTNVTVLASLRPEKGQVNQLHVFNKPRGKPRQITFGKNPVRKAIINPLNDRSIIFLRDEGGSERYQIFHYDLATGKTVRITDGKNRHTGVHWSSKGDQIAYFSPKRNGRDNDLYISSLKQTGSEKLLLKLNGGGWKIEDWSSDGRMLLIMEYISINESRIHIVDTQSGEISPLTPKLNVPVSYQNARFDPNLRAVYFTSDDGFDFQRLTRLDLSSGEYRYYLDQLKWDVELFELSPDGETLAVVINERAVSKLRFLNVNSGAEILGSRSQSGVISALKWGAKKEIMYGFSSALSPGQVVYHNIGNDEKVHWV